MVSRSVFVNVWALIITLLVADFRSFSIEALSVRAISKDGLSRDDNSTEDGHGDDGTVKLPNFFIIGAIKGGTTALRMNLRRHWNIYLPRVEVHWFDRYRNENNSVEQYGTRGNARNLYSITEHPELKDKHIVGDCTPNYAVFPYIAKEMHQQFPDAKIIMLIRNPIKRAYSHYGMYLRGARKRHPYRNLTLAGKVAEAINQTTAALATSEIVENIITCGFYGEQLEIYSSIFGRNQILVLCSEEVQKTLDYNATMEFLGVRPSATRTTKFHVASNIPDPMDAPTVELLKKYYAPYNKGLVDWLQSGPDKGTSEYHRNLLRCVRDWDSAVYDTIPAVETTRY